MGRVNWSSKDFERGCKRIRDNQEFEAHKAEKAAAAKSKKARVEPEPDFFCDLIKRDTGYTVRREFRFHTKRRWRFDYCIEQLKIAIEIEGGVWSGGRHTRGKGYINDCEKYNNAQCMGWIVLRFTPTQQMSTKTASIIQQAIQQRLDNGYG